MGVGLSMSFKKAARFILLGMFFYGVALAEEKTALIPNDQTESIEAKEYTRMTCPLVESLKLDPKEMKWSTQDGWKSANPSFVRSVRQFVGAQWTGVNVGDVICLYIQGGRSDFPVTLHKPLVVLSPSGGAWGADQGGHKNCHSTDVNQCAFEIENTVIELKKIYDSIDFHRGKPVEETD